MILVRIVSFAFFLIFDSCGVTTGPKFEHLILFIYVKKFLKNESYYFSQNKIFIIFVYTYTNERTPSLTY